MYIDLPQKQKIGFFKMRTYNYKFLELDYISPTKIQEKMGEGGQILGIYNYKFHFMVCYNKKS
jgi:hypothetical protein